MPLSAAGKKILKRFISRYGTEEGKSHFYAKENASRKFAKLVTGRKKKR